MEIFCFFTILLLLLENGSSQLLTKIESAKKGKKSTWQFDVVNDDVPKKQRKHSGSTKNSDCKDSTEFTFGSYNYEGKRVVQDCKWLTKADGLKKKRQEKWCKPTSLVTKRCPLSCEKCKQLHDHEGSIVPSTTPSILQTSNLRPTAVPSPSLSISPTISPTISHTTSPTNPGTKSKNNKTKQPMPSIKKSSKPTRVESSSPSVAQTYIESSFQPTQNMRESSSPSRYEISLGYSQSAVIPSNGELRVWGSNLEGQLFNDFIENIQRPKILSDDVKNIKFGSVHSCIIFKNDKFQCWGDNKYGQLGNNSTDNLSFFNSTLVGTVIGGSDNLALGKFHTCASLDSKLKCWGYNRFGQLGDGTISDRSTPTNVLLEKDLKVIQVSAGHYHTCAMVVGDDEVNDLRCWGLQFGDNTIYSKPRIIPQGRGLKQVSLGAYHACLLMSTDSQLKCWGYNNRGQVGDNTSGWYRYEPKMINVHHGADKIELQSVSLGGFHSCAVSVNNELFCWGENSDGQLGDGTIVPSVIPRKIKVANDVKVSSVALGDAHSCVVTVSDKIYCWGSNWSSQLGVETSTNSLIPVQVNIDDIGAVGGLIDSSATQSSLNAICYTAVAAFFFLS